MKKSEFYQKTDAFLKTIGEKGKKWNWLAEKMVLSESHLRSLQTGVKVPSGKLVSEVAVILRNHGSNIFTPKQILPTEFGTKKSEGYIKHNIAELLQQEKLEPSDIYQTGYVPKNTVSRILRNEDVPNFKTLEKIFKFFHSKKIVTNLVDLIYFPHFGELPFTYINYKNKYKI